MEPIECWFIYRLLGTVEIVKSVLMTKLLDLFNTTALAELWLAL